MLNPMDFYLWLSEEIQTLSWDSKAFGTRFGLAANFVFLLARANAEKTRDVDDVFGDAPANGWVGLLVSLRGLQSSWNPPLMCANRSGQLPPVDVDLRICPERILHNDAIAPLPTL